MDTFFDLATVESDPFNLVADAPLFGDDLMAPSLAAADAATDLGQTAPVTISPQEVMLEALPSAPPSAAFTNLTSPSLFDSPDLADSFDTSPLFPTDSVPPNDPWYNLFASRPGVDGDESPPTVLKDMVQAVPLGSHAGVGGGGARRRSSPLDSPRPDRAAVTKHSSVAGVSPRRRDKPLPPIRVEDPTDAVAVKRARNTLAARKSRQKKLERFDELLLRIEDLEGQVTLWKGIATRAGLGPGA